MKKIIEQCPKTYKAYKKYLINKLKVKYPDQDIIATDNLIMLSITESPISCLYYFDTIDMVGTLHYTYLESEFNICVNGSLIDVHEDHQQSKNRKKAEEILIEYLFIETEKTL